MAHAADGAPARVTTKRGSVTVAVEVSDTMQAGHVSLPNGLGLDYPGADGTRGVTGAAPNELTASEDRDWFAGTPWHKHVPARVEAAADWTTPAASAALNGPGASSRRPRRR